MNVIFKSNLIHLNVCELLVNQFRGYARWSHRRPIKVIPPENFNKKENKQRINDNVSLQEEIKIKWRHKTDAAAKEVPEFVEHNDINYAKSYKQTKPKKALVPTDMLETVIDANGNFVYTKMRNNDPRVGSILTSLKSRKEIAKRDLVLLEGKRLISDALQSNCKLKYLLFSRKEELEYLKPYLPKIGVQLYKMPYREMQMWSNLTTCPGIMGIFKTPDISKYEPENPLPITILCDNIREPGNLGAILRCASGLGCHRVLLTKGCVNLWDNKVTRSAAGAIFRMQIHEKVDYEEITQFFKSDTKCFIADNKIISSEDAPINSEALEVISSIPIVPYYSVKCSNVDEIIIIVGGETKGISLDSYKFAKEYNGVRLNIPLDNGVDSLNTGMALGIISFEFKRQLASFEKQATDCPIETDVSLSLRYL